MKTLFVLFKTEVKLSLREFSGVLFGILLPMGIMILLGIIFGNKPAAPGVDFTAMQQAFAGVIAVGICASGLMGLPLTMSGYRERKILKRFKVTPTHPGMMLGAQVLTNALFAILSALMVWLTAKFFFGYTITGSVPRFLLSYLLVLMAIFSIGMVITSVSKNTKSANLLCSLIYFPMFFLSGGTIPYEIMPRGLQRVSDILPLTQGIKLLKTTSLGLSQEVTLIPIIVLGFTTLAGIIISLKSFKWE
ncbi:MAG: ABC transporter permease [Spirochaetales bacterium]|nr:ABC transporter permease [Spirochaetales bacterium]